MAEIPGYTCINKQRVQPPCKRTPTSDETWGNYSLEFAREHMLHDRPSNENMTSPEDGVRNGGARNRRQSQDDEDGERWIQRRTEK